jgi:hypothetical protein
MSSFLCFFGLHDYHRPAKLLAPQCRRCGKRDLPRNVVQKNIIAGGDVCAGDAYHPVVEQPVATAVSEEVWKGRFIHVAGKLGIVLGLNNEERGWVREAGFTCPPEDEKRTRPAGDR